ncbi:uncharacterized protein EMH_0014140 [Eimeria mitis]|uniref:Uncharacterized protein n=1 Tax=Eimeria mitis TaxID=44415 RepID=U6JVQ6_9EIME|nr:uncharacterized protein EMH_0014140 [Eimeria mitis]CDJ28147.1 hypothetical protein, conserved [Eimeria mitis]
MARKKPFVASGDRERSSKEEASSSSSPSRVETSQHSPTDADGSAFRSISSNAEAAVPEGSCSIKSQSACGECGDTERATSSASSSSSCGGNSRNTRSGSNSRKNSTSNSSCSSNFVSDDLLREFDFEDFSRASCWEQLQHEFVSCLSGFPFVAARRRYLQQVADGHAAAAAAAAAALPTGSGRAASEMHSYATCSSSWHAYAVPPPRFACLCCSPQQQQQQQRCALSLQLFAPLVLQLLLPVPKPPAASPDAAEAPRGSLLRLTYTCTPPMPELGCCCCNSNNNSSNNNHSSSNSCSSGISADAPAAEKQLQEDQHPWDPSVSPVFFSSSSGYSSSSSSGKKELREFLQLETVRPPKGAVAGAAAATGSADRGTAAAAREAAAAAVPLQVSKETARAALGALVLASRAAKPCQQQQQQQQILSRLPLFSVYDPQHGDCVGSQVLLCAERGVSAPAAAAADAGEAGPNERGRSSLLIRHYELLCLPSAFASCDLPTFLHLLLPHLGAKLQHGRPQREQQQHALSALQQLMVCSQYTYFLPAPWQQTRSSSSQRPDAVQAARLLEAGGWWLQHPNNTCSTGTHTTTSSNSNSNTGTIRTGSSSSNNSSSRSIRPSKNVVNEWREAALGAASPSFESNGTVVASADRLLQLLLVQRCPFEALHVIWCSPLQQLGDFWSSSRSSSRPLAAAFDCRLRLNLYAPLLQAHEKLLQHYSLSTRTLQQQALQAADFLQEDTWQQQCGVTSRIHQLSRLLLLASSSSSNSSNSSSSSIKQQPFVSLSSRAFRGLERTGRSDLTAHNTRMLGRVSAAASKRSRRGSTVSSSSNLRSSSNSSRNSSSGGEISQDTSAREAEAASLHAEVQQLFRPMTAQQQLLIHQQQVKRLLLTGSSCFSACSCCCSACGCCGIDLAFGLLWGGSSSSSFFAELALCAGQQQQLSQLQRLWQQLLMRFRWMWDQQLLLPRVVSGITAATANACAIQSPAAARTAEAAEAAAADATGCEAWSALAAGLGVACCPDGPIALPDVCCCSLQQLLQQLNCATQQQRLQQLLQGMPEKQKQQPFESLRFLLPGLPHLHEPILPILPPITEASENPRPYTLAPKP